ncbi:MAG: phosphatidylinositol mannoside acyltransferase [Nocardioidaceae bacterium]|nr:phosphatidylinositol mannoside acyltransferase [Nocardioidaceae bacterium]
MNVSDRLLAQSYRAGWWAARTAPERTVTPTLRVVADRLWARRGGGVTSLEANLARAVPQADPAELRELSHRAMRSYLRYWGELVRLPSWSAADVRSRVVTHDEHRLRDPLAAGRGVVAALPHMGNWDLAGAWACAEGMPLTTVAERLRPESLYDDFLRYRQSLGMTVLPLSGGPPTMPILQDLLEAGGFVCLLADRDLSRHGVTVRLLGQEARLPVGPALLARRTGAVLLPASTTYDGCTMHLRFHQPVDVLAGDDGVLRATAELASVFSSAIARDPADWHMLQRVFVDDLAPRTATTAG